jgi:hypothetical protein
MVRIKWHRAYFENLARPVYEDSTGRFEIIYGWGDDKCWWILERNGVPSEIEPRHYLADAKAVCEAEILNTES